MHAQLFNYHISGAKVRTRPASSNVVSFQGDSILGVRFAMWVAGAGVIIMLLLVFLRSLLVLPCQVVRHVLLALLCSLLLLDYRIF